MKKLLFSVTASDCRFDYFRGKGKGGQKKNVTDNCCRCTHEDSGAVGKAEQGRSQRKNKELAFKKMAESKKFKIWHTLETSRRMGQQANLDRKIDEEMKKIKVEGKLNGTWVDITKV